MFNAYLTSKKILQKNVFYFFPPLLHNGIQISYSLSFSSLDTLIPPPMPIYVSVPLEVSKCQIQRHFGWWYAIDRGWRMFPNCTSIT